MQNVNVENMQLFNSIPNLLSNQMFKKKKQNEQWPMAHMVHYVWSIELVGNRYGKLVCAVVFFNILLQSATLIFITSGYKKQAKFIYYFTSHLGHKNWMV